MRNHSMHIILTSAERKAVEKVSKKLGLSMSASLGFSVNQINQRLERLENRKTLLKK